MMTTSTEDKTAALAALATLDANTLKSLAASKKVAAEKKPSETEATIIKVPAGKSQISEAAKGVAPKETTAVALPTRRDLITDLPTMHSVTKLAAVRDCIDISVVSLPDGQLKDACITEADPPELVDEKVTSLFKLLSDALSADKSGVTIDVAIPDGRAAVYAVSVRSDLFRNRRNGVVRIRADEAASAHLISIIHGLGGVAAPTKDFECTHEIMVPNVLFPASVIAQILKQLGMQAIPCRVFEYNKSLSYRFAVTSAAQLAIIEKKGGVTLGKHGVYPVVALRPKLTFETIYALGCTGEGSARLDLVPEMRTALAVSKDMVTISQVPISGQHKACVLAIKVPFSQTTYDAIYELLDVGRFKLVNPRKPKCQPLEILLAPSLLELQAASGLMLVDPAAALIEAADDDEEEVAIEDLSDPAAALA